MSAFERLMARELPEKPVSRSTLEQMYKKSVGHVYIPSPASTDVISQANCLLCLLTTNDSLGRQVLIMANSAWYATLFMPTTVVDWTTRTKGPQPLTMFFPQAHLKTAQ